MSPRRMIFLPWLIWALVLGVAIGGALYASGAHGQEQTFSYTFENGNKLTILSEPCPLGGWFKTWRRATYLWNGETVEGCWRAQRKQGMTVVYTLDAQGDVGEIPAAAFQKDEGV